VGLCRAPALHPAGRFHLLERLSRSGSAAACSCRFIEPGGLMPDTTTKQKDLPMGGPFVWGGVARIVSNRNGLERRHGKLL